MTYGRDMKPSQSKKLDFKDKLLELFYRINRQHKWYDQRDSYTKADKKWVESLINDVRHNSIKKLSREDGLKCNGLWRQYERK